MHKIGVFFFSVSGGSKGIITRGYIIKMYLQERTSLTDHGGTHGLSITGSSRVKTNGKRLVLTPK